MPTMARRAGAEAAVRIDPTDARIGPASGRRATLVLTFGVELQLAAVALLAAGVDGSRSADDLAEQIVERAQDLTGLGVVRAVHLLELGLMAGRAVFGRHHDGDELALVLEGIDRALFALMAVQTVHAGLTVRTVVPLPVETGILGHMTIHALLAAWIPPVDPGLPAWACRFDRNGEGEKPDGETQSGEIDPS